MSGSSLYVPPVSEEYIAHCIRRAEHLRDMKLAQITPASVAYLLNHSSKSRRRRVTLTNTDERCKVIARILKATGSQDGIWHHIEVMEAYRLRSLTDAELAALDPDPPKPTPVEQLPENLQKLNAFSQYLAQQTQSALRR